MKKMLRRKRYRALAAILVLVSVPAAAALTVQWKLYRQNLRVGTFRFPEDVVLGASTRALVIAPHCDDETLGCSGIMARTRQRGGQVVVVVVTNGDGSRSTAAREYHRLKSTPGQLEEMGRMRQDETLKALAELGVPREHVTFLGYPDRGIDALWQRHWTSDDPFTSPFTRVSRNPYRNSLHPDAVYCGASVLNDLREVFTLVKPTDLFVTDPHDTHGDHWATHAFTCAALESLRADGAPFAQRARVWTYLIHRDGGVAETLKYSWPAPVGLHPDEPLAPPEKLLQTNTRWHQEELSPELVQQKLRAVQCYRSQMGAYKKFMLAFVRKSELFGTIAPPTLDWSSAQEVAHRSASREIEVVRDPTHDGFAKDLIPNGDLKSVKLRSGGGTLHVALELYAQPSNRIAYLVEMTGLNARSEMTRATLCLRPGQRVQIVTQPPERRAILNESLSACEVGKRSLCARVPTDLFADSTLLLLCARSRLGSIQLDKTALRVVRLQARRKIAPQRAATPTHSAPPVLSRRP